LESGAHPLARVRQTILGQDNGAYTPQPVRISAENPGHSSSIIMTASAPKFEGLSMGEPTTHPDEHAHFESTLRAGECRRLRTDNSSRKIDEKQKKSIRQNQDDLGTAHKLAEAAFQGFGCLASLTDVL